MSWLRDTPLYQVAVEEGREQDRIELGSERLGPPEQAVLDIVGRIDDHEKLKRLLRDSFTASSWQELVADA